jgi:3-hydroxyisobutyrate dehydrogenase
MSIYTRTQSKSKELIEKGAKWLDTAELAKQSDFLFLMLGYPKDVEEVVLHPETGILHHMKDGAVLIDHTTSSPDLAVRIYEEAKKKGV